MWTLTVNVTTLRINITPWIPAANAKAASCEDAKTEMTYPKAVAESPYRRSIGYKYPTSNQSGACRAMITVQMVEDIIMKMKSKSICAHHKGKVRTPFEY